jgi:predicted nucleotidyltransferase
MRTCSAASRAASDIDLLVTFAQPTSCFRQLDLKDDLLRISRRKVELMTQIDPAFEPYITPTLVPIPL